MLYEVITTAINNYYVMANKWGNFMEKNLKELATIFDILSNEVVITSYSIHYTKLYEQC